LIEPASDTLSLSKPVAYAAKLKRESRATRSMMWLWTGEVATEGQGYRALGTSQKGSFQIPPEIAKRPPAVFHLRVNAMNANGKIYSVDKIIQVTQ
jgi:hypothetical protein